MIAEKIGSLEASFHTAIERLHQTTPPDGLKEAHKRLASNLLADFLKDMATPEVPAEAPVVVEVTGEECLGEGAPETTGEVAPETTGEVAPETTGEVAPETTGEVAPVEGEVAE